MDQVVTDINDNITRLCNEDEEAHLILSLFGSYYGVLMTLNILFLIFTGVKAKQKSREMFQALGSDTEDSEDYDEDAATDDYDLYEPMPDEYVDKRRQSEDKQKNSSNLHNIIEDCESVFDEDDEEEERDYFPSASSDRSSASSNISKDSISRTSPVSLYSRSNSIDQFNRSHSTGDCAPYRHSLTSGLTKNNKVKRTESQNKADYLLKVMTQGGKAESYQPTFIAPKISPTGRKISVDRLKLNQSDISSVGKNAKQPPIYQNVPIITIEIPPDSDSNGGINSANDFATPL